jgi:hypothetical protein
MGIICNLYPFSKDALLGLTSSRPSRFEAQKDATGMIFEAKTQSNPESSVGLMSMGAQGPEVLTTLTTDMGRILEGLHRTKIRGSAHVSTGINIAAVRDARLMLIPGLNLEMCS